MLMISACWTGSRPRDVGAGRAVCHQDGMICFGSGGGALRGVPAGMGSAAHRRREGKTFPRKASIANNSFVAFISFMWQTQTRKINS